MARRITRQQMRYGSWAVTVLLAVVAALSGHLRLWLLPLLFWAYYELCLCPTTCGIQTTSGGLCRHPASGRLYACQAQPSHSRLKINAFLRLLGIRRDPVVPARPDGPGQEPAAAGGGPRQQAVAADFGPETATIDSRQTLVVLLIVLGTFVAVVLALIL